MKLYQSNGGERIDTRCLCETEAFNCNQGRNCPLREPVKDDRTPEDDQYRARFWFRMLAVYVIAVVGAVIAAFVRHP